MWSTLSAEITFLRLVQLLLTLESGSLLLAHHTSESRCPLLAHQCDSGMPKPKSLCCVRELLNQLWRALDAFLSNNSRDAVSPNSSAASEQEYDSGISQQLHLPLIHAYFLLNSGPALAASQLTQQQQPSSLLLPVPPVLSAGSPRHTETSRSLNVLTDENDCSAPSVFNAFCQRHTVRHISMYVFKLTCFRLCLMQFVVETRHYCGFRGVGLSPHPIVPPRPVPSLNLARVPFMPCCTIHTRFFN